ncbi:MAG: NUDIX hydrolase [Rhodospirillales bacterium]|nr:NUDIX hydrolase [Rhodospirillales bacterium]
MTSREYPTRPLIGLGIAIIGPAGVLLIKRGKPPRLGAWSLPGGAQKIGETVAEGLAREAREETGLEIEVLEILDVVDSINHDTAGLVKYHYTLIDAAAIVTGGGLQAGSDAMDARWFATSELDSLDLWSETLRIIHLGFNAYAAR